MADIGCGDFSARWRSRASWSGLACCGWRNRCIVTTMPVWHGCADKLDTLKIAGGEDNHGIARVQGLLIDRGCFDILQPDALLSEGIFQLRKVGGMAEAANLEVVPHTWGNGMGLLANLHLAASLPNCAWLEFPHDPPSGFTLADRAIRC